MCSGFKPKARFYGLLGLKNRHFYAVPGTAGKSSSADKPRGSPKAPENSRISREPLISKELMMVMLGELDVFLQKYKQARLGLGRTTELHTKVR